MAGLPPDVSAAMLDTDALDDDGKWNTHAGFAPIDSTRHDHMPLTLDDDDLLHAGDGGMAAYGHGHGGVWDLKRPSTAPANLEHALFHSLMGSHDDWRNSPVHDAHTLRPAGKPLNDEGLFLFPSLDLTKGSGGGGGGSHMRPASVAATGAATATPLRSRSDRIKRPPYWQRADLEDNDDALKALLSGASASASTASSSAFAALTGGSSSGGRASTASAASSSASKKKRRKRQPFGKQSKVVYGGKKRSKKSSTNILLPGLYDAPGVRPTPVLPAMMDMDTHVQCGDFTFAKKDPVPHEWACNDAPVYELDSLVFQVGEWDGKRILLLPNVSCVVAFAIALLPMRGGRIGEVMDTIRTNRLLSVKQGGEPVSPYFTTVKSNLLSSGFFKRQLINGSQEYWWSLGAETVAYRVRGRKPWWVPPYRLVIPSTLSPNGARSAGSASGAAGSAAAHAAAAAAAAAATASAAAAKVGAASPSAGSSQPGGDSSRRRARTSSSSSSSSSSSNAAALSPKVKKHKPLSNGSPGKSANASMGGSGTKKKAKKLSFARAAEILMRRLPKGTRLTGSELYTMAAREKLLVSSGRTPGHTMRSRLVHHIKTAPRPLFAYDGRTFVWLGDGDDARPAATPPKGSGAVATAPPRVAPMTV